MDSTFFANTFEFNSDFFKVRWKVIEYGKKTVLQSDKIKPLGDSKSDKTWKFKSVATIIRLNVTVRFFRRPRIYFMFSLWFKFLSFGKCSSRWNWPEISIYEDVQTFHGMLMSLMEKLLGVLHSVSSQGKIGLKPWSYMRHNFLLGRSF